MSEEKEYSEYGYRCPNHGPDYQAVIYNFVTRQSFCADCGEELEKKPEGDAG